MTDLENITQHFRPDEANFIEQVQGWVRQVADEYRPVLTHFLNPRQRFIAQTIVNREDGMRQASRGGLPNAEMQRMLIYPDYYVFVEADFHLQLMEIVYPTKFADIHHNQILGTLVNQGIERNVFGDILGANETWQFLIEDKMVDYFSLQVDRIGNIKVHLMPHAMADIVQPEVDWVQTQTTIASLRIDVIISTAFNISRSRVKTLVEGGAVRLNWTEIIKPDYELATGDMLSVRGFGRMRLVELEGTTKKDKLRVVMETIQNNKK
ncbi:RNA-binding protein [Periweissella cryptocerci]|uniref:YlmH family RNA-binding protein n=1 Tax=Periweissella cryptocerci TaxID=2506420 RepID=UPI001FA98A93|nr:YlmH/Sll1252 family protein [Periweissella cryptocerci]